MSINYFRDVAFVLVFLSCVSGENTAGSACTFQLQPGTCKPFKKCPALLALSKAPVSEENLKILRDNVCFQNETHVFVCCPNESLPEVHRTSRLYKAERNLESKSEIKETTKISVEKADTKNEKPEETPPMSALDLKIQEKIDAKLVFKAPSCGQDPVEKIVSGTEIALGSACTFQLQPGTCKPFKRCPALLALSKAPVSEENSKILRDNVCFKNGTHVFVCCPNESLPEVHRTSRLYKAEQNLESKSEIEETTRISVEKADTKNEKPEETPPMSALDLKIQEKIDAKLIFKAPSCGQDPVEKIVGGTETALGEFPWLALIGYDKPNNDFGWHCGGSLLNSRYVITAAHCVKKIPEFWSLSKVRLGEHDFNQDPDFYPNSTVSAPKVEDYSVAEQIVHPDFNENSRHTRHDVALLRLKKKVKFDDNSFIRPICLPLDATLRNADYNTKDVFEVAGWGKTETTAKSSIKLKVDVPFFPLENCQDLYRPNNKIIDKKQLCAGGVGGKDSCNGDSGGPMMGRTANEKGVSYIYLAGIVSYGAAECGTQDKPGVYSRISEYIPWILDNLEF